MDIETIRKLRELSGAGVMDAKRALDESNGDFDAAFKYLREKGIEKAAKKAEREIKAGRIFSYIHGAGKIGSLIKLGCETDFVAKNENFEKLGNEVAMQVAAMGAENVEELLEQDYIRDSSKKIKDLLTEAVSKTGENMIIAEIIRFSI